MEENLLRGPRRIPRIDRSDPKNDIERLAEDFISNAWDGLEGAIRHRAVADDGYYGYIDVGDLERAADNPDSPFASEKIRLLESLDKHPLETIEALNKRLVTWATDPGDEEYADFAMPEFRFRNTERYARAIADVDYNSDFGVLVQLEGVLLYLSDPPQVEFTKKAYECQQCGSVIAVAGSEEKSPAGCDSCGSNKPAFRFLEKHHLTIARTFQEAALQEAIDDLAGSPRSINVRFFGDGINKWTPGDRITILGVVNTRRVPMKKSKIYEVDVLQSWLTTSNEIAITDADLREIEDFSKEDPLSRLASMFVPGIIGHEDVKRAIILQAVGGVKHESAGLSVRGRIHILLAGDPGQAKSQFLVAHRDIVGKSLYVSDTSKAGITAAVTDIGGKRVMVPGIMVLANHGVACIDELDKLQKDDRSGMLTAMEQGIISKRKAGLDAVFKADTSVLAAANPIYGRFDISDDIPSQLNIESNLLDRFDLIFWFISEQTRDRNRDVELATKVLRPKSQGNAAFVRKYIKVASALEPECGEDAERVIAEEWAAIRERSQNPASIGHRHLQAIKRLAEASAKVRFSPRVEEEDVSVAIELMMRTWDPLGMDTDRLFGFGKSIRDCLKFIVDYLGERAGGASKDEIASWANRSGFSSREVEEALEKLETAGRVYKPRDGMFKVVA